MWIVRLALNRPYTFVVASLLIMILGVVAILSTPTDVFPSINIPVVSVVWNYSGLSPQDMADRLTGNSERAATTTVNDIQHIESTSLNGISVIKLFFQPGVKIEGAVAQVTAISQTILRQSPPGTTPPLVIAYNASSVPILQLGLSSETLSEQELFDLGTNFIRTRLVTVPGAAIPWPYGGKQRQIDVDLDPKALFEKQVSGADVVNTLNSQNLILPQGTSKIGDREYNIEFNSTAKKVPELNDLPIKLVDGAMVYVRDVAYVHDGASFQTNIVRQDGHRGALLTVLKNGNASTLAVVAGITNMLPDIQATLPPGLTLRKTIDQSLFVRAAVNGVLKEAIIAALLTAIMILIFLGSWRSTLVVAVSIPLSILTSLLVLSMLGETINIMTLGGLALAVGILVDDATVEIENINRLLPEGKSLHETILTGAQQIAVPAFVATLSICIVFVPIFFMKGIAGYLFRPLAEAVVFAMLASYLLSRTIVPTLVLFFFRAERRKHAQYQNAPESAGWFRRFHNRFEHGFEEFRDRYVASLEWCLHHRLVFGSLFLAILRAHHGAGPIPGRGSCSRPWMRGKFGCTFVRRSERAWRKRRRFVIEVEASVRQTDTPEELSGILDNIGLPYSGINLSYSNSGVIGTSDAEILISLKENHHPTADYIRELRRSLPGEFPGTEFFFQPADIVSQILNFGLPAPIDIQLVGPDLAANYDVARQDAAEDQRSAAERRTFIFSRPRSAEAGNQCGSHKARKPWDDAAGRGEQRARLADDELSNGAEFLAQPAGRAVQRFDADAAVSHGFVARRAGRCPVIRKERRSRKCWTTLPASRREAGPAVVSQYDIQPVVEIYASAQDRDLGRRRRGLQPRRGFVPR